MTLYGLLASLAWAATAAFCICRGDVIAHRWLSITEKRVVAKLPEDPIVVPDDLMALALGETEKWAQDSVIEVIRERWNALHDWNKVRMAMGIGGVET